MDTDDGVRGAIEAMPEWMGLWFGVLPRVETLVAQGLAALIVIGSCFAANRRSAASRAQLHSHRRVIDAAGGARRRCKPGESSCRVSHVRLSERDPCSGRPWASTKPDNVSPSIHPTCLSRPGVLLRSNNARFRSPPARRAVRVSLRSRSPTRSLARGH